MAQVLVTNTPRTSPTTYAQVTNFWAAQRKPSSAGSNLRCPAWAPATPINLPATTEAASLIVPVASTSNFGSIPLPILDYLGKIDAVEQQLGDNDPAACVENSRQTQAAQPSACISVTCAPYRNISASSSCQTVTLTNTRNAHPSSSFPSANPISSTSTTAVSHESRNLLVTTIVDPVFVGGEPPVHVGPPKTPKGGDTEGGGGGTKGGGGTDRGGDSEGTKKTKPTHGGPAATPATRTNGPGRGGPKPRPTVKHPIDALVSEAVEGRIGHKGGKSPVAQQTPPAASAITYHGQVLTPGAVVTTHGTVVSFASNGEALVVGGSTFPIAQSPLPTSAVTFGGQTLTPGEVITSHGTVISFAANGEALVIGGSTSYLGQSPISTPVVTYDGQTLTPGEVITSHGTVLSFAANGGALIIGDSTSYLGQSPSPTPFITYDGQTLTPGEVITVHGTTISYADSGTALVIDGSTSALPTDEVGCYIMKGVQATAPCQNYGGGGTSSYTPVAAKGGVDGLDPSFFLAFATLVACVLLGVLII